jgi:CO/xanthine dehydrogenase Mo-binding subunit
MIDILAEKLNMDPLELRLKNAVQRGDRISSGKTLVNSTGALECLRTIGNHRLWQEKREWKAAAKPFKKRGVGIGALAHGAGYGPIVPDVANAKVELTLGGKIRVYSGVVDMGQGNASTSLQIAGTILCQSPPFMELILPDTDKTLPSGSASASRCTYTFGNALIKASEKLKARILERAADLLMVRNPSDLAIAPGMVRDLSSGKEIPLTRMALYMNESERVAVARFRAPVAPERFDVGAGLNLHGFPHTLFSFGACLAMVEVDELTGEVTVCHYLSSTDCGKIINPDLYEQQIQGAIAQGIGYALTEDLKVEHGVVCSANFETYIIPSSMDIPDMESIPVEIFEETGPYGLKGLGEIATNGPAGAIANAIHDACGVRIMDLPMKPESLLLAMQERNRPGQGNSV